MTTIHPNGCPKMHRALQIPEVIRLIIRSAFPGDLWFERGREDLLNVALTCRAFSGPALDALWHYMSSLNPLFNLLSNFQSSSSSKLMDGLLWGPISKVDLVTVQKYASRIRYLQNANGIDDNITIYAYMHLFQACGHRCLLPNLTCLRTNLTADSVDTSKIISLISPSLREVYINSIVSSIVPVRALFSSLQTHAPNIAILEIGTVPFDSQSMSAICSFLQLQEVSIDTDGGRSELLNIDFFNRISSNQTLRRFSISGEMKLTSSKAYLDCGTVEFPALESINLRCLLTSVSPITTLLRNVSLPSLRSLSFDISSESAKPDIIAESSYWDQFFDLIGNVTTNRFKSLEVSYHSFNELHTQYSLWKAVDLTVSKFPNLDKLSLENFVINTPILRSVQQIDVQTIINSWPRLRCLHLTSCRPFKLGFDILLDIALGLPNLTQLGLSMEIQELPVLDEIPLLEHRLEILELEISFMQPVIPDFAQSVDKIFPRLVCWNFDCPSHPNFHGRASPLLIMLQKARGYEAKRASLGMRGDVGT